MRVIVPVDGGYPAPAELASSIAAVLVILTLLLAALILGARWLLRRLGIAQPSASLGILLILAFGLSFLAEAARQMMQAYGDLTAADATGLIIDNARFTAHGWTTIVRRAAVAAIYAGVVATAFWLVSLVQSHGRKWS